jgi:rare lipoprotein A
MQSSGSTGTQTGLRIGLALATLLALAACEGGTAGSPGDDTAGSATSAGLGQNDVEAPDIFQATDEGLWDGRPSLGGVWVAHPDVQEPERVIIRNESNGASVIGALFRRERENPGPLIQVSSDAAEALQMLAGAPARLNVTALRREEAPAPASSRETATAAAGETPAGEPLPDGPEPAATDLAAPSEIGVTTLDPVPGAAAAIAAAEAAGVPGTPAAATAPAGTAAATAPSTGSSGLGRPYIQLGIFSIEANATALAQDLETKGLATRVVAQESQGKKFWRVLVGPAQTEAQRAEWLDKVKAEGFADAYFVAN